VAENQNIPTVFYWKTSITSFTEISGTVCRTPGNGSV